MIVLAILVTLAGLLAFGIGSQDQTFATTVGSGSLDLRKATVIAGVLVLAGTVLLSSNVSRTIGVGLLGDAVEHDKAMILAILGATSAWLIYSSMRGAPISTTHTVVGAVFGVGVAWAIKTGSPLADVMNWTGMAMVASGWIISPVLGYVCAILVSRLLKRAVQDKAKGLLAVEKYERAFRHVIVYFACVNQLARAGNDAGNALGIFFSMARAGDIDAGSLPALTAAIGFLYMAGLLLVGRRIITSVGFSTGELRPSEAASVEGSTGIVMLLSTILGFPVSGTHVAIFSLFGNARTRGERPERRSLVKMIVSWILTFPAGALLAAMLYWLLLPVT